MLLRREPMTFLVHFSSRASISNLFLFFISLFWLSCCLVLSRFRSSNQDKPFNFSLRTSWVSDVAEIACEGALHYTTCLLSSRCASRGQVSPLLHQRNLPLHRFLIQCFGETGSVASI